MMPSGIDSVRGPSHASSRRRREREKDYILHKFKNRCDKQVRVGRFAAGIHPAF